MWFDSFDCASWVLRAFEQLGKIGAKFNGSLELNYTRIHLYSDVPIYLGRPEAVFANKTLAPKVRDFYKNFQNYHSVKSDLLHILHGLVEIMVDKGFYFFYNFEYWFLPMRDPFFRLTYNKVSLPGTESRNSQYRPYH